MGEVTFTDLDGNNYIGDFSLPDNTKSVVIIVHGFTSSKDSKNHIDLQDKFNEVGIGSLRFDLYGHGKIYCESNKYSITKETTLSKTVESLKAAIKFVKSKGSWNIALVGASFGGLVSLIVASQEPSITALALK